MLTKYLPDKWGLVVFLISIFISSPILIIFFYFWLKGDKWDSLINTVLFGYLYNTIFLVVSVILLSLLMSIPPAWMIVNYNFFGRNFFNWALVLPLTIPTYIAGFIFYSIPESSSDLLIYIRDNFGMKTYLLTEKFIRYFVLILLMSSVLFPYIYISARSYFQNQGRTIIEATKSLGSSSTDSFFKVILPMAFPSIISGCLLVMMEVINDYGAVHFFGVSTLTKGIFKIWFDMDDKVSALHLSSLVLITLVIVLLMEKFFFKKNVDYESRNYLKFPITRKKLSNKLSLITSILCFIPLLLGFIYPFTQLAFWAYLSLKSYSFLDNFNILLILRSIMLAIVCSIIITLIAIFLSYSINLKRNSFRLFCGQFSRLGYSIPSAIIGISIFIIFGFINRFNISFLSLINGTIIGISFGYLIRFFAIPLQFSSNSIEQMGKPLIEESKVLGKTRWETFIKIYFPLLKKTFIVSSIVIFIDILKELPLTLILSPPNFETPATLAFSLVEEGNIYASSIPSIIIILTGILGLSVVNYCISSKN